MSKIEEVRSAMVAAMKAGDKGTKETLSLLLAALKNKAIDKREDLTPEEEVQVVLKEIKQTKETGDGPRRPRRYHRRMYEASGRLRAVCPEDDG